MTRSLLGVLLGLMVMTHAACLRSASRGEWQEGVLTDEKSDVVLLAVPFKVSTVAHDDVIDAVEAESTGEGPRNMVVMFEIEKVIKGDFTRIEVGGPGKMAQAQQAVKSRNLWQILTLDFSDPDEEYEKKWASIAVRNPEQAFGIASWEKPGEVRCKLFLKEVPEVSKSYYMVKSLYQGKR